MPWLIDGDHDETSEFLWGGSADTIYERVVTGNRQLLDLTRMQQYESRTFPGDQQNNWPLYRACDELGDAYYRVIRPVSEIHLRVGVKVPFRALPCRARLVEYSEGWYCDRFKRLLEALEPGKHIFVPIDLRHEDGVTPWPERYWFWRCKNVVDALVPDIGDDDPRRSRGLMVSADKRWLVNGNGNVPSGSQAPAWNRRIVLTRAAVAGHHAWLERGFGWSTRVENIYLSDEFVDELQCVDAAWGLGLLEIETSELEATRSPLSNSD